MKEYGTKVYLVNTGWSGGSAQSGAERMPLSTTRSIVTSILNENIEKADFEKESVFGLAIPSFVDGVDNSILRPRNTWSEKNSYDQTAKVLAGKFRDNFKLYSEMEPLLEKAGPRI